MNRSDIPTGQQPDPRLANQAIRERAQLWESAEGRFGWRGFVTRLCPVLLISLGVALRLLENGVPGFIGRDPSSYFIIMGLALLGLALWVSTQRQLAALRELVKLQEREQP